MRCSPLTKGRIYARLGRQVTDVPEKLIYILRTQSKDLSHEVSLVEFRPCEVALTEDFLITKLNAIVSEIKREDDLIGQRTTWLVMGQSFMFGAFASLIVQVNASTATQVVKLLRIMIALVGLVLPVLVLLAVSAAIFTIWRWRAEHERVCKILEAQGLDWPHVGHNSWVMIIGHLLPIAVAFGFTLAWIFILIQLRNA